MVRKLLAVAAMALACAAQAQDYPSKPIRIIIPSTPGGGTDYIGRLMGSKLHELNGWAVVPENKPGAGTALGLAEAARAPAQGYDLVIGQSDNVTLIPLLMKVSYDPIKDLAPVALVATTPMVLLVAESSPYKSLPEVIEAARKDPNKISYGTSGTGGGVHIAMEMLQHSAGVKMQHVPYKGSAPALADLMGGHLQFAGSSISSAASLIKAGKVRALATTGLKRSPLTPDLPTVSETVPGYEATIWLGVMAPKGTPKEVVTYLNAAINKVINLPEVKEAWLKQGAIPLVKTPEEFDAYLRKDIDKWAEVVKVSGAKVQ